MKSHHRYGKLLLPIALLATASMLVVSRRSQPVALSDHGKSSASSPREDATFHELPRTADRTRVADRTLVTKASRRPPGSTIAEADQPRPGETTYRMENLPKASGTYWVEDGSGGFSRIAVCPPES